MISYPIISIDLLHNEIADYQSFLFYQEIAPVLYLGCLVWLYTPIKTYSNKIETHGEVEVAKDLHTQDHSSEDDSEEEKGHKIDKICH